MKPSKNILILTAVAAIVGGLSLALIAAQKARVDSTSSIETQSQVSSETKDAVATQQKVAATPTPEVSTDLKQEADILTKEFLTVAETDFSDTSLEDSQLGL